MLRVTNVIMVRVKSEPSNKSGNLSYTRSSVKIRRATKPNADFKDAISILNLRSGLDYPEWYSKNTVRVLCAGLDYYCYQTVRELPPFFSHRYRIAYSNIETVNDVDDIKHPAVREVVRTYGENKALEISHVGDLPSKVG